MVDDIFRDFHNGDSPNWIETYIIKAAAAGVTGLSSSVGTIPEEIYIESSHQDPESIKVSGALVKALITNTFFHPEFPGWSLHDSGLEIEHAVIEGDIELVGIIISKSLSFYDCKICDKLLISDCKINGTLSLRKNFYKLSVELTDTELSGDLKISSDEEFKHSWFASAQGPNRKLTKTQYGSFNLDGVKSKSLEVVGSGYSNLTIKNTSVCEDIRITGKVSGQVNLTDSQAGRDLDLSELTYDNKVKPAEERRKPIYLSLRGVKVSRRLRMPHTALPASIDLSNASCLILDDCQKGWPAHTSKDRLYLGGFKYARIENPTGELHNTHSSPKYISSSRERWLLCQPDTDVRGGFNPQPWKEAAAALAADGHEQAAKFLTIRRRVAERHAKSTPITQKLINFILHGLADYGFNPWKTVFFCIMLVLIFSGVFGVAEKICSHNDLCDSQGGLFLKARHGDIDPNMVNEFYPEFDPIAFSLGTFVPIFELSTESFWRVNTRAEISLDQRSFTSAPLGYTLYWLYVFERIIGAVMVAIAITGFTGMLARDP